MKMLRTTKFLAALALVIVPATALAATTTVHEPSANDLLQVGAGVNDYRTGLNDATKSGEAWDVRLVFGARQPLGIEAAYIGALNDLTGSTAPGVGTSAPGTTTPALMMNGGEALLRANLGGVNGDIQPYLAAGFGVLGQRVVDRSDLSANSATGYQNSTDLEVPAAVGIDAFLQKRLTLGARIGYRYDFHDTVRADARASDAQAWNATARLGFAF